VSTSIGVKGAHITVGHGQVRETVGIPGTGLSYTETQLTDRPGLEEEASKPGKSRAWFFAILLVIAAVIIWRLAHGR
jgi:hypothetical protein